MKHGMYRSHEYRTWEGIIQRCTNPKSKQYKDYGGRGIHVCDRWRTFINFFEDMGKKPKGMMIERTNNELGYYKENCCWATHREQSINKRIRSESQSGVKGVYWLEERQKYQVQIGIDNKNYTVGYFGTIQEATIARQNAEKQYWNTCCVRG